MDQGTYGMMQKPPPVYKIKERKPKVYSSYAVDNPNCTVHSKNLKKQVQQTSLINLSSCMIKRLRVKFPSLLPL